MLLFVEIPDDGGSLTIFLNKITMVHVQSDEGCMVHLEGGDSIFLKSRNGSDKVFLNALAELDQLAVLREPEHTVQTLGMGMKPDFV